MKKLLLLLLLWTSPCYAAFSWDSANTQMEVLTSNSINDINSSDSSALGFSISAWAFPNSKGEGGFGTVISKASNTGPDGRWWFQIDPNAAACTACIGFYKIVQGTDLTRQSTTNMSLGQWNHVAMTWDGTKTATGIRIYINGTEVAYGTTTNGTGNDSDRNEKMGLGNDDQATPGNTWDGRLSDIAIWSGVISPDEVRSLNNRVKGTPLMIRKKNLRGYWPLDDIRDQATSVSSNVCKDRSGNNNDATPFGTARSYADDWISHQ